MQTTVAEASVLAFGFLIGLCNGGGEGGGHGDRSMKVEGRNSSGLE